MSRIADEIVKFLNFRSRLEANGFLVEAIDAHGFVIRRNGESFGQKFDLLSTALIHGNEVVGIEGLNLTLERILARDIELKLDVGFLLCNVQAALAGVRFIDVDLNRSFLVDEIRLPEQIRAAEIARVVERADFLIDLHQTVEPTLSPFFIFEHTPDLIRLARSFSSTLPIVTFPPGGFSQSGKTILEMASSKSVRAVTVEWGQMGFSAETAKLVADFIIGATEGLSSGEYLNTKVNETFQVHCLTELITNTPGAVLREGLVSFMDVSKGEILGQSDAGAIVCPADGKLFFPKYGALAKVSAELCEIGIEMRAGTWPPSD